MSGVDVSFHIITEDGVGTILLTTKIEFMVREYQFNLTYKDAFIVDSGDLDVIFNEVESLQLYHPFCMMKSCESPIEVAFFCLCAPRNKKSVSTSLG